jgi:hypothetical protein
MTHEVAMALSEECKYFATPFSEKRVMEFFRVASADAAKFVLYALQFGKRPKRWKPDTLKDIKWALERSGALAEDFISCRAALV